MNKSLQLALCDTQGKLFELSGTVGYESESFAKAFMTTDVAADMDKTSITSNGQAKATFFPEWRMSAKKD